MDAGEFPFPEIQQILEKAWLEQSALDLTLMTLDRDLSSGLRADAARAASQFLATQEVREAVRRRLLGTPLPEEADLEGAPREGVVADLVREAAESRDLVALVDQAWDQAFWKHLSYNERQHLKAICIAEGGFSTLVGTLQTGEAGCFLRWLGRTQGALAEPEVRNRLREWQDAAFRLYMNARLRNNPDLGDEAEAKEVIRDSLEEVELGNLALFSLSKKAEAGVVSHGLVNREVREHNRGGSTTSFRRRLLARIGVGRV